MLSRITRLAALAALSGALVVATPAGADAEKKTEKQGSGWIPYQQEDVHYDAGFRCEFAVDGTVLRDREEYKDVAHWPNGQVHTQLWRGALVMRWTNAATGESVVRDQSASGIMVYNSDGSFESLTSTGGAFSAGLPEGSPQGKGVYVIDGRWSAVVTDSDGTRAIVLGPRGSMENLCETLG
jgi:hypothetical protein